jgi:hypothetical protein
MIGLFILSVRAGAPPSLIPETFGPSRIHVPKAPGLGLLLVEPQYIEYNKRVGESNTKTSHLEATGKLNEQEAADSTRETIDPVRIGLAEKLDAFKSEQVYKRMWQVEEETLVFSKWLNYLDTYVGNDFECVFSSFLSSSCTDHLPLTATSTPRVSSPPPPLSRRAKTRRRTALLLRRRRRRLPLLRPRKARRCRR